MANEEKLNTTKTSFLHTYWEPTPLAYYKSLTPLGYNEYHDRFSRLVHSSKPNLRDGVRRVIDIGCLYGSTAIAYAHGAKWSSMLRPDPITDLEITGVDISEPALQFGLKAGVFHKTIVQDLNSPLSGEFYHALDNADTLLCMMCLNYFKEGIFADVLRRFADRGGKYAIYGTVPLFDERCYAPKALGLNVKWSRSVNLRHRSLTEDEIKINGGMSESFVRVYVVEF